MNKSLKKRLFSTTIYTLLKLLHLQYISYITGFPSGWAHLLSTSFQIFQALQGGLFYHHLSPCVFCRPLCELV